MMSQIMAIGSEGSMTEAMSDQGTSNPECGIENGHVLLQRDGAVRVRQSQPFIATSSIDGIVRSGRDR